jgi:hypothetical protein
MYIQFKTDKVNSTDICVDMFGCSFMIAYVFLTKYYECGQIKEDKVGGHVAGMGRTEIPTKFCLGNLQKENP